MWKFTINYFNVHKLVAIIGEKVIINFRNNFTLFYKITPDNEQSKYFATTRKYMIEIKMRWRKNEKRINVRLIVKGKVLLIWLFYFLETE